MKIVILYVGYSGYFCACCRALSRRKDVSLRVFARAPNVPFSSKVTAGVPLQIVTDADYADYDSFSNKLLSESPTAIILPGWELPVSRKLVCDKRFKGVRFLTIIDTSWRCSFRQICARFALRNFVKHVDGVIVGGERGRLFARWIGFLSNQIFVSAYGCDYDTFASIEIPIHRNRTFLYVARYVEQKGIDTLIKAYQKYRTRVKAPWSLHCYGSGPLGKMLTDVDGIEQHGFAQPNDLPRIFSENGVYILPSKNEPWGVSLAEAASAGMPLICSHMVTSGVDVVRHLYNGLVFPAGNAEVLCKCMEWCHNNYSRLYDFSVASRNYGRAFSADVWAERIVWAIKQVQ